MSAPFSTPDVSFCNVCLFFGSLFVCFLFGCLFVCLFVCLFIFAPFVLAPDLSFCTGRELRRKFWSQSLYGSCKISSKVKISIFLEPKNDNDKHPEGWMPYKCDHIFRTWFENLKHLKMEQAYITDDVLEFRNLKLSLQRGFVEGCCFSSVAATSISNFLWSSFWPFFTFSPFPASKFLCSLLNSS